MRPPKQTQLPEAAEVGPIPDGVTGPSAVLHSIQVGLREMGTARTFEMFTQVNQTTGFDCPSCAWPDPAPGERHRLEFCENGAKAFADEATRKIVGAEFFAQWSISELRHQTDHWLNAQGRLTQPMVLRNGATHYEPIAWDEAYRAIAGQMRSLASPDEAAFYTSGRTSNEAAFVYQLLVRRFGTNNLPDCSNMCHESSGVGLTETIGVGKSTVTLSDLENAPCILLLGQNPATNHPRMLTSLQKAVRNGAKIISVNPLREAGLLKFRQPQELGGWLTSGTPLTSHFLQVRINGDVPLFLALSKLLLEKGRGDAAFIREHTEGFEAFAQHLRNLQMETLLDQCGVPLAEIKAAAQVIGEADGVVACWAMGLTQHKNAVDNIRELVNLMLLTGNIGKPNAGLFCVRGHSNVQGDRTMGITEKPSAAFLQNLQQEFGFQPPTAHGYDTVGTIAAMQEGKVKLFFAMGGNFLSATPDTPRVAEGLARCQMTVHVATKLNRSHLQHGHTALLLPCLGRTDHDIQQAGEQFVTTENSLSVVGKSKGVVQPPSQNLRSEVAIVCELASALWPGDDQIPWGSFHADYAKIRERIGRVVPGFADYNQRLDATETFPLDIPPSRRVFPTPSGKARFTVNPLRPIRLQTGELLLTTVRSHDQFNTTIYGLDDRYRGIRGGRNVLFIKAEQLRALGLSHGDWVDLHSNYDGIARSVQRFQLVAFDIPMRCAAAYFPETNPLIPATEFADGSHTPISKSVVITLTRSKE